MGSPPAAKPLVGLPEGALATEEARRKGREAGLQEGREARLQEGREAGLREGQEALSRQALEQARQAVVDLSEVLGLVLTEPQRADLAGRDLAGLTALRAHLKNHRRWP